MNNQSIVYIYPQKAIVSLSWDKVCIYIQSHGYFVVNNMPKVALEFEWQEGNESQFISDIIFIDWKILQWHKTTLLIANRI